MDPDPADDQSLSQYTASHETITRIHTRDSLDIPRSPRTVAIAPLQNMHGDTIQTAPGARSYLPAWVTDTLAENESLIKKVLYIALAVLCVFVAIGYVYARPGSNVKLKWRRSVKKLKRLSRSSLLSFKEAPGIYPYAKDLVHVAHVILNHIFD